MTEFRKEENMPMFQTLLHGGPLDGVSAPVTQDTYSSEPLVIRDDLGTHVYQAKPLKDDDPRWMDTPPELVRDYGWFPRLIQGTVHYRYRETRGNEVT